MAKEIKAIKCPNCGSTDKTEIKPDQYRCNSCQTEYFLDNDDININYRYTTSYSQPADDSKTIKNLGVVILCVIIFFVLVGVLGSVFTSGRKYRNTYTNSVTTRADEYSAFYSKTSAFLNANKQPVVVSVMQRNYFSNQQKTGNYLSFYDPIKKDFLKDGKVNFEVESSSNLDFRTFNDGTLYLVVNKGNLFKVDKTGLKLEDVTQQMFGSVPELQVGVATFEFVYRNDGDGFKVMTNNGKTYYYYPQVKKIYNENNFYDAKHGMKNVLPGAKEKTYYTFTSKSMYYPDEKLQLLRVTYLSNAGGPEDRETSPSWSRDYGGSGIFTDRDPYRKVLFDKDRYRVISYADITPGRIYFEPSVVYYDSQQVIIDYKATPSPGAARRLQCLDAKSGKILWSTDIKEHLDGIVLPYSGGFVSIDDYTPNITIISTQGKVTDQYTVK